MQENQLTDLSLILDGLGIYCIFTFNCIFSFFMTSRKTNNNLIFFIIAAEGYCLVYLYLFLYSYICLVYNHLSVVRIVHKFILFALKTALSLKNSHWCSGLVLARLIWFQNCSLVFFCLSEAIAWFNKLTYLPPDQF